MYANSITCVEVLIHYTRTKYTVQEIESTASRANGAIVAEFIIKAVDSYEIKGSTSINVNGHGHGSSGHSHGHGNGHDHGHGADNAGGGIVEGELSTLFRNYLKLRKNNEK